MRYPVETRPLAIQQPAGQPCLIVNEGPSDVYLDTQSSVSTSSYSLKCAKNQSVNWQGGTLWAISDSEATLSLMIGSNTSITPITDVNVAGEVNIAGTVPVSGNVNVSGNVGITGGNVNVASIQGDVSVDGSTVNIGNNVKLWGGGNYLGGANLQLTGGRGNYTWNLGSLVTNLNAGKYNALRVVARYTNVFSNSSFDLIMLRVGTNILAQTITNHLTDYGYLGHVSSGSLEVPIVDDDPETNMSIRVFHITNANAQIQVDLWGTYEETLIPGSTSLTSENYLITPTSTTTNRYISMNYRVPIQLYILPTGVMNAPVSLAMSTWALNAQHTLILRLGNTVPSTGLKSAIIYPIPSGMWHLRYDFNGSNTGDLRLLVTTLKD